MSLLGKIADALSKFRLRPLAEEVLHADFEVKRFDKRLPLQVIPGLCNVVPWNTETTQISTDNWPSGKDSFFLELEGTYWKPPTEDVKILDGDGETNGLHLRNLSVPEREDALRFAIEHWPITLTPHVRRVS